jgi:AbiV family abortive infection protein
VTRGDLKLLSQHRIREAKLLLDNNNYSGAYYLAGYSIECALKACIARQIISNTIPEKKFINDFYTHDLKILVKLAALENDRLILAAANVNFDTNWNLVKDWNETSRYKIYTRIEAQGLYTSITERRGGILPWIRQYW